MVTTKLNLSMTEPQVRQIYAKQGDTGRVLDITLDQTPEDGTLRILRPDGVEVTSEAVTGGEVESGGTFESLTEADVTELTVGIEPVQDLSGYDKPWVGGAGTNKYDDSAKTNALINEQGAETTNTAWYLSDYCAIPSGTTKVTLSWQSDMTYYQGRVVAYDSSKAFISGSYVSWAGTAQSHTFDIPSTASFVRVNYSHVVNSQESPRNNVRLNVGTSDLAYAPYSNICPITGHDEVRVTRTGKNLCPMFTSTTKSGLTYDVGEDGSVHVTGTCTGTAFWAVQFTLPKGTYVLSGAPTNGQLTLRNAEGGSAPSSAFSGTLDDYGNGATFTVSETASAWLNIRSTAGTHDKMYYPMIRLASETDTSYEPYQGSTYTTSLGQTVYGGTLDMVSGVLTVDRAMVDLGTLNWAMSGSGNTAFFYANTSALGIASDITTTLNYICENYSIVPVSSGGTETGMAFTSASQLRIRDATYNDATSFKTAMNGVQLVYELATPQTYTLTAQQIKTLVGTNNVWASSGDIVSIKFAYGGLLSELPSDATSIVGKCYCDIEQNGVSSMPFTLNVKKNERQ